MPNELIITKGAYKITKKFRRVQQRHEEHAHSWNDRVRGPNPKNSLMRLLKLIGFYLALYVCIAIVLICNFAIVFNLRVPENQPHEPRCTSLSSVPGNFVGSRKMIRYTPDQRLGITPYVQQIYKFVEKYGNDGIRHLRACNLDNNWGYNTGLPCVLLKLNFAHNFTPITYSDTFSLPKEVPNDLYDYILQLSLEQRTYRIWVGCSFMDNITDARIEYIPNRYYDTDGLFEKEYVYLQYISENMTAKQSYENPAYRRVVGVQFRNLPMNRDITVKCVAWAKNIPMGVGSIYLVFHLKGLEVFPNPDPDDDY
ncbi:probable sodium/potassium-transporting ATPase subunit beta-3 [Drosophila grimshawi]|uniref:GH22396 n=1 Tax=Drosophila grimshawi TaxID=7222 RepID=B4JZ13_DROGR|nr:probable sodium/potassium-transporting ATPase subunit beta-3 [Drosophila grimshawi]EDV98628.1 GH22396 [Drosophila grimshawi]